MKKLLSLSLIIFLAALIAACGSQRKRGVENITKLEKEISARTSNPDTAKVIELTSAYRDFAVRYAADSLAPAYLLRAGGLFMNVGNALKAIESLNQVTEKYGSSMQAPQALFLEGFIFENMLGNLSKARELYSRFLVRYPKHNLANDAQSSLNNLGKTPEQVMHEFEVVAADSVKKAKK
jgi:hypothetical protein